MRYSSVNNFEIEVNGKESMKVAKKDVSSVVNDIPLRTKDETPPVISTGYTIITDYMWI